MRVGIDACVEFLWPTTEDLHVGIDPRVKFWSFRICWKSEKEVDARRNRSACEFLLCFRAEDLHVRIDLRVFCF